MFFFDFFPPEQTIKRNQYIHVLELGLNALTVKIYDSNLRIATISRQNFPTMHMLRHYNDKFHHMNCSNTVL